jgi:hypothetical protein
VAVLVFSAVLVFLGHQHLASDVRGVMCVCGGPAEQAASMGGPCHSFSTLTVVCVMQMRPLHALLCMAAHLVYYSDAAGFEHAGEYVRTALSVQ